MRSRGRVLQGNSGKIIDGIGRLAVQMRHCVRTILSVCSNVPLAKGVAMEPEIHIRMARTDDLSAMLAIYAPVVRDSAISFEYEPPTLEEFSARFATITRHYPWLVAEVDGVVAGYTYAGPLFSRRAYMWNAELSTYVAEGFRRMKLAERLIRAVDGLLVRQGYCKAYALISALNLPSIRLMEHLGFEREGCLRNVGFKLDEWHDVVWYARQLRPLPEKPDPPLTPADLPPVLLRADADADADGSTDGDAGTDADA